MRFGSLTLLSIIALSAALPAVASSRTPHHPTSSKAISKTAVSKKTAGKHAAKPKILGQRTIDDERATQIQTALIKAGYLTGVPSGHWDAQSEAAMQKVQADNGWQTKLVPDSRAIIKLGLGPNAGPSTASSESIANPSASIADGQISTISQQ